MKLLDALAEQGLLAPVDVEFGTLLGRRAAATLGELPELELVAMSGALLSAERARGNSCIDLRALAGTSPWPTAGHLMPPYDRWRDGIQKSGLCCDGTTSAPLVLDGDRLYLYRFHAAEQRLADSVRARLGPAPFVPAEPLATDTIELFRRLFPADGSGAVNWQAVSAAAAMRSRLTVITGGPGTGKTTTVARILALLLHREPGLRVALAAPTGKAAARLAEAIHGVTASLPVDRFVRECLPSDGQTLHRLLGYWPVRDRFARRAGSPVIADVIVVDEASMVDVLMMDALFAALRPEARVILIGDQNQLASVETGYVLGDICQAAESCGLDHGPDVSEWYSQLSGQSIPANSSATPLRDAVVQLHRSYRFEHSPGIGALAASIGAGAEQDELDTICGGHFPDVRRRESVGGAGELLAPIEDLMEAYLQANSPELALERFAAFRILCALRDGSSGVTGLNDSIERWLRARGTSTRSRWYDHRPILVTANDSATRLFNGDVGVVLTIDGSTLAYFPDATGDVRAISPARLPRHETAWAMTVHKSQGSEFHRVVLVLPPEDNRVLTRELLYTGVTRAREAIDIVASSEVFAAGVARRTVRVSGLSMRLTR